MANEANETATDSATVIVLREGGEGPEVFMVRRHTDSGFMPDRYVYPGGKLDAEDCSARAVRRVEGRDPEEARERLGEAIPARRALGLFLAGIRETFEEAGLLLARREDDEPGGPLVDLGSDPAVVEAFREARDGLAEGRLSLTDLAERQGLVVPLERIGYFAHWITPYREGRRYDTRFFVVLAPEHQEPLHGGRETTDSEWARPAEILRRNDEGELMLAPPTRRTLRRLTDFARADDVLAFAQTYDPPTILPHVDSTDGGVALLLPGDPDYPGDDPDYAVAEPVDAGPTRLTMIERGRWRPADASGDAQ